MCPALPVGPRMMCSIRGGSGGSGSGNIRSGDGDGAGIFAASVFTSPSLSFASIAAVVLVLVAWRAKNGAARRTRGRTAVLTRAHALSFMGYRAKRSVGSATSVQKDEAGKPVRLSASVLLLGFSPNAQPRHQHDESDRCGA